MRNRLKISPRRHSWHLLPHEYTSYAPLALLLIVVGIALAVSSVSALGPDPPPQASSIGLTGTMPGPPPKTAAVITAPHDGQHVTTSPAAVSGTCPDDTIVEIYKNDIFAGSGPCAQGSFSFDIDLLVGNNTLIARDYDALNQAGPDSAAVNVFYDVLPAQAALLAPLNFGGSQLLLNTNAVYRGIFPDQLLNIPLSIIGGVPPYAVNVQWGDSSNKVVPRNDNLTFNVGHTYTKAGTYQVTLQGSDSQGRVAFLTVAAIVNGQPAPIASTSPARATVNQLLVLWPLFAVAVTVVISFWLGERRERHVLAHAPVTIHA
jgi:hypothetical protein